MFTLLALLGAGCVGWFAKQHVSTETVPAGQQKQHGLQEGFQPAGVWKTGASDLVFVKINVTAVVNLFKKIKNKLHKPKQEEGL